MTVYSFLTGIKYHSDLLQLTLPSHFFIELCQFPTIQLSYQLASCQFPTRNYPKPGGGGHPYLHLQQHPRLGEGGREEQR